MLKRSTSPAATGTLGDELRLMASTPKFAMALTVMYVHLWIVEGALRKWVPGTEQVLYVARDGATIIGLALGVLFFGLKKTKSGLSLWIFVLFVALLSGAQIIVGLVPPAVGLMGLRSYVAPALLVYVAWCYGRRDLLHKMARIILFYAPFELAISVIQVLNIKSSWINKEVGSDAAYFVNGAVVRTSGTFSAPAGLTLYVPLCLAVCLWILHQKDSKLRLSAIVSLTSAIIATIISGARGTVLACAIVLAVYIFYQLCTLNSSGVKSVVLIVLFAGAVFAFALSAFPEVFASFNARFDNAAQSEDSSNRILSQIFDFAVSPISLLGDGVGTHSMAGIALGANGPWIETESLRWVAELGLFGWLIGMLRIGVCFGTFVLLVFRIRRLPMNSVLLAACLGPVVLYGQITQFPTAQAFFSVCLSMLVVTFRDIAATDTDGTSGIVTR